MQVGLGPGHIVLDGDPVPPKLGTAPQFLAYVYCGQVAGWIKMPLGMKVGLGPCHSVLDWDPAPHGKGHNSPLFSTHFCCGHGRPPQLLLSFCFLSAVSDE